jgi:D-glycerate 3-kinase
MFAIAERIAAQIGVWRKAGEPLILGLCGTQASGKTTACAQLSDHFSAQGLRVGMMSLDDLYLGRAARAELALRIHPLYQTRGPAGTHDVALGLDVLGKVRRGKAVSLPRFAKALDEPFPQSEWPRLAAGCDLFLFEGWCVGAKPQSEAALIEPVNALERDEDPDGIWRRAINAHLGGPTAALFEQIDRLVYLRPPSFEIVFQWRCEQEHELIAKAGPAGAPAAMSDTQIARFIAHYERTTRHIAAEMPARADLTIQLGNAREIVGEASP